MKKSIAFKTLGCKVNQYDTEALKGLFRESGFRVLSFSKRADVYLINTCTVTHQAARKSRKMIRRAKKSNPRALVVAAGCYSQAQPDEISSLKEADLVLGTRNRSQLPGLVKERLAGEEGPKNLVEDYLRGDAYEELGVRGFTGHTRAMVKVQEGCEQHCSYCLVPEARGPLRSRSLEQTLEEIRALVAAGYDEVVLTGIHLGAYGKEQKGMSLSRLVTTILEEVELPRLRLSSLEMGEVDDLLLEVMAADKRLCRHLHLPLQSGSDKILSSMKRPYRAEEYRQRALFMLEKIPGLALTTDLMVGFPGEAQEDFDQTLKLVEGLPLSGLHVFPFSPRPGTPAFGFQNRVSAQVKKKRSARLMAAGKQKMKEFNSNFLGQTLEVLIEEERDLSSGSLVGLTDNYIRLYLEGEEDLKGRMVALRLEKLTTDGVWGKIVDKGQ